MHGVIPIAVGAEEDILASLRNHAKGWLGDAVNGTMRRRESVQVQPFEWLDGAIFAKNPCHSLHQLLAIRLYPLRLTFCLLVIHPIHTVLFRLFFLIKL